MKVSYISIILSIATLFSACHFGPSDKIKAKIASCSDISAKNGVIHNGIAQNEETAKKISEAIVREYYGPINFKEVREVQIIDGGNNWIVRTMWKGARYDGNLNFKLNKCNATLFDFEIAG